MHFVTWRCPKGSLGPRGGVQLRRKQLIRGLPPMPSPMQSPRALGAPSRRPRTPHRPAPRWCFLNTGLRLCRASTLSVSGAAAAAATHWGVGLQAVHHVQALEAQHPYNSAN
jgi:hypothetical protein